MEANNPSSPQHQEQHHQQQQEDEEEGHEPVLLSASDLVPLYLRIVLHMFMFWLLQNINKLIISIPLMLLISPIILDPEYICVFLGIKLQEVLVQVEEEEASSIKKAQYYFITAFRHHALLFMNMLTKLLRINSLREKNITDDQVIRQAFPQSSSIQEYYCSLNCFLPLILLAPIFFNFGHYYYWFILYIFFNPHYFIIILTSLHYAFIDPNSPFRKIMPSLAENSKTFVDWYLEKLRVNLRITSVYSCMLYQLYICFAIHLLAIIFHFLLMPHCKYLVCIVMFAKNMLSLASIGLFLMAWVEVYTDKVIASKKMMINLETKDGIVSVDDQSDVLIKESHFNIDQQIVVDDDDDINNEWIHLGQE